MHNSLLDLIICRIPGLRGDEKIELAEKYIKEDELLSFTKNDIEHFLGRSLGSGRWKMEKLRLQAEKDKASLARLGIRLVSWREEVYPPLLREIFDPPLVLFYRGCLPDPEKPMAAVVGTRKPTSRAASGAFELGRELGRAGISVVSGLAVGIDSMAHRGNLDAGASTVAVLGSGPDMIYPSSNRDLARRILETGGLILSEYPPGTAPKRWTFPARNRIISALARGTVIVEAPEKSGALITARFALEQGRDLWVHSAGLHPVGLHPVGLHLMGANFARGAGTARLACEGAKVISSGEDILKEWNLPAEKPDTIVVNHKKGNTGADMASSLAEYLNIKV